MISSVRAIGIIWLIWTFPGEIFHLKVDQRKEQTLDCVGSKLDPISTFHWFDIEFHLERFKWVWHPSAIVLLICCSPNVASRTMQHPGPVFSLWNNTRNYLILQMLSFEIRSSDSWNGSWHYWHYRRQERVFGNLKIDTLIDVISMRFVLSSVQSDRLVR